MSKNTRIVLGIFFGSIIAYILGHALMLLWHPMAVLFIPYLLFCIITIFLIIPFLTKIMRKLIDYYRKFYGKYFYLLIILFLIFAAYLFLYFLIDNMLGLILSLPPYSAISLSSSILFFYLGIIYKDAKQDWFISIKTPWALGNPKVWEKTHRITGTLFKIFSIICLAGPIFKNYVLLYIFILLIIIISYASIYSYREHKRLID